MRFPLVALFLASLLAVALGEEAEQTVQMLVPGFRVQQLPVRLPNINNLRFHPKGELYALGYNGRIYRLRDTDGDRLEDSAELFWDQPSLSVPVGMAWSKEGLYVSSHGKVSLIRDMDADGKADREEIIASGWPATDVASGGVDATAVTVDEKGNVYFGLLTADYSNPYRLKDGIPHYDLNGPRGTIQKWSPATRTLQTVATGIRVPYNLAFNRHGDLFVTDQEGETWCPGGNPLDELNHIMGGRNYGFPPRHEKYLPGLISELPVVAFGPQHQSTCGFCFNEAGPQRRSFGPQWWEGDALVAGESRGKVWRVSLIKTADGYIGRQTLIAALKMLTTDVVLSPGGDLYVSCHSGLPDWGTGPNGEGKLYKISYVDDLAPQPAAIWPAGPMEVQIAFDRPIDPAFTNRWSDIQIEFGEFVRAGDRFETLEPPYQVVKQQQAAPRGKLRAIAAKLRSDRTIVLATDPHPLNAYYAVKLPGIRSREPTARPFTVEMDYQLNGVEARWTAEQGAREGEWSGWLPHLDFAVNRVMTAQSPEHQRLFKLLESKGSFESRGLLSLPSGKFTLRLKGNLPFRCRLDAQQTQSVASRPGSHLAELKIESAGSPQSFEIRALTGSEPIPQLRVSLRNIEDRTIRPLPFAVLQPLWAPQTRQAPVLPLVTNLAVARGDWSRGRDLFRSEQLKCASCHRVNDDGGLLGPDLSNLVHRDAASVLRDIQEPNLSIHPDYVAFNLKLRNQDELVGFVRAQTEDELKVLTADNRQIQVRRSEVQQLRPSSLSIMPEGLLAPLGQEQIGDLLAFLVTPPAPTDPGTSEKSSPRGRVEIEAILQKTGGELTSLRPLRLLLVASQKDHGPGEHDYPAWQKNWIRLLGQAKGVQVDSAWDWPSAEQLRQTDAAVFYYWNHDWSEERWRGLDDFLDRGGGVVILHSACIADRDPEKLAERIGLAAQPVRTKYRHGALTLKLIAPDHPICRGLPDQIDLMDETYWPMIGDPRSVTTLATALEEGAPRPMVWLCEKKLKGRVFGAVLGHYSATFDDPLFRLLVLRGIAWACREPENRLQILAIEGVK